MSDRKDIHSEQEDSLLLDDILQEVSAWSNPAPPPKKAPPTQVEAGKPSLADGLVEDTAALEEYIKTLEGQEPPAPQAPPKAEEATEAESPEAEAAEEEAAPKVPDNITRIGPTPEAFEEAGEAGEPEKVVPLFQPKEPETIREAAQVGMEKVKVWWRLRKDKVKVPKVKVKRVRIHLPELRGLPEPPDTPPKELAKELGRGLGALRLQSFGAIACSLLLFLLALFYSNSFLPLPPALEDLETVTQISLALFFLTAVLCYPVLTRGIGSLIKGRPGMEFTATLAAIAVTVDAATMLFTDYRTASLPLFAPAACVLAFQTLGMFWKKRTLRLACRTAALTKAPDLMTYEPSQWNGKAVYRRRQGSTEGFGSQIQQEDGAQKRFRLLGPLLVILAITLSLLATVFRERQDLVFWSLSGTLIAASTLSGTLCFSMPFRTLSRRFSKIGVALAGWEGAKNAHAGNGILLDETDLFPPGSIELISYRVFGNFGAEKVLSCTASLIRAAGSGLDPLFYNLLRTEIGEYGEVKGLHIENEGITGQVNGDKVIVGTASYLERMGVDVPSGVRVKTGAFTAISGFFAGQFILEYHMHKSSAPAMEAMMSNRIVPILIALDFNMVPSLLKRQFKFPWDKMSFPDISQRVKLTQAPFPRDGQLMAVLTMEGMAPLAMAAAGAQRLSRAVRQCARICVLGALIGVLLAYYLSMAAAVSSLSAVSLTLYLILWFVPTMLISGWVNQF